MFVSSPAFLPAGLVAAAALLLASTPTAQTTIVSPIGTATVEGNSVNTFPFTVATSRRYLQVHSDLGIGPRQISQVSFRANGGAGSSTAVTTTDLEMYMGPGVPWDHMSFTFDSNYVQPKTQVIARKTVNLGPQGAAGTPSPFTMHLVLDTPFLDVGLQSLVWEVVIHSNVLGGTMLSLDADACSSTAAPGRPPTTITGPGCIANGASAACAMDMYAADLAGLLAVGVGVDNAPPNMPALLTLGITDPNQAVPGLCANLHTELLLTLPIGVTSATGTIGELNTATTWYPSDGSVFVLPNSIPGVVIYSQVHVLEIGGSNAIPIINSNGRRITMPTTDASKTVRASRMFNNFGGATATRGVFFNTTTLGYALVTQFTY